MPVDMKRYPPSWKAISERIRFGRARGRCEWPGCRAVHGEPNPITGSRVVLTTAHLPIDANGVLCDVHDKQHATDYNLLALCQSHHLLLDGKEHAENARRTRRAKHAENNPSLFEGVVL